jgi:hypothetical protein
MRWLCYQRPWPEPAENAHKVRLAAGPARFAESLIALKIVRGGIIGAPELSL